MLTLVHYYRRKSSPRKRLVVKPSRKSREDKLKSAVSRRPRSLLVSKRSERFELFYFAFANPYEEMLCEQCIC